MDTQTRNVVAANVRARMAWAGITVAELERLMGWSRRTSYNRLHARNPFTIEELVKVAALLECEPGDLCRIPLSFSSPSGDVNAAIAA